MTSHGYKQNEISQELSMRTNIFKRSYYTVLRAVSSATLIKFHNTHRETSSDPGHIFRKWSWLGLNKCIKIYTRNFHPQNLSTNTSSYFPTSHTLYLLSLEGITVG